MIFVTIGSALEPFSRLLDAMDEMAPRLGEEVVMQCGRRSYPGKNTRCFGYITFGQLQQFVRECGGLIGHGSTGPVLMAYRYQKPLIMVPRRHEFGETADAHPLEAARFVERRASRMTEVIHDVADLEAAVRRAQQKPREGWIYECRPERERLLAAIRTAVEGREVPAE